MSASTSPLIKGSVTGPITKVWVLDYSYWTSSYLSTTIYDQPGCTGRSAIVFSYLGDVGPIPWDGNLGMYEIDTDTVFRSVILEPKSKLTLTDEDGASYNLVNDRTSPSCKELPDAKLEEHLYAKLN